MLYLVNIIQMLNHMLDAYPPLVVLGSGAADFQETAGNFVINDTVDSFIPLPHFSVVYDSSETVELTLTSSDESLWVSFSKTKIACGFCFRSLVLEYIITDYANHLDRQDSQQRDNTRYFYYFTIRFYTYFG